MKREADKGRRVSVTRGYITRSWLWSVCPTRGRERWTVGTLRRPAPQLFVGAAGLRPCRGVQRRARAAGGDSCAWARRRRHSPFNSQSAPLIRRVSRAGCMSVQFLKVRTPNARLRPPWKVFAKVREGPFNSNSCLDSDKCGANTTEVFVLFLVELEYRTFYCSPPATPTAIKLTRAIRVRND